MSIVGFESDLRNTKVFKILSTLRPRTRESIRRTWFAVGRDLKNEANKEILRTPKSGTTYIIRSKSGRARRHVASAPGETHANLSGDLRKSIGWKVHGAERMDFGYGFSTIESTRSPEYDHVIEDGFQFKDGREIKPRPSIANAIQSVKRSTQDHFRKAMLKQFTRV
jgi:hypothetical protein